MTTEPTPPPAPERAVPPSIDSVREAAARLAGVANRTPVVTSRTLDERAGAAVFLKCESFQRIGAFKFRGAYTAISRLPEAVRARGVVTFSSGNHGQAVALVGRLLGVPTVVVIPENAPAAKIEATRGYGAEVVLYDPVRDSREAIGRRLEQERGMTLIPPYDHPDVVAGQGTAALELFDEVGALDVLITPCGGGGLLSGSAIVAKAVAPGCRVIGVEPALADDATRSFYSGTLQRVHNPPTLADGLRTPSLGAVTWPLVRERVDEMRTVTEREIVEAMRFAWTRLKLVVEPSAAAALAPLLAPEPGWTGRIGVIVSGGNVDLAAACRALTAPEREIEPSAAEPGRP
ncbi:MAG TPA: threo-3-hydroxy-L-aspartate ammonia-lyase [Longimicrobiaceae bacterium]|nr:threo-3-hydroxy-L-aspartate ammonia-lyase [Longimicrobiaceae bacterium]